MRSSQSPKILPTFAALALSALLWEGAPGPAYADPPAIAGYGLVAPVAGEADPVDPSLHYRVIFEGTQAAPDPAKVNPILDRAARFLNLLAAAGVHPAPGDLVVVIHGAATPLTLDDDAYRERFHIANPNIGAIEALRQAGVAVHVCSYALANAKIARTKITNGVTVDVAAMLTLANLQLKGWALIRG